jgi:FMN reductase
MTYIVTIAGSASASAQSSAVIEASRRILRRNGLHSDSIVVRNLPSLDLLSNRPETSALEAAHCLIERAQGIVIATPIQEATYAGLLRTFLETLPYNALQDKTVLPITTGGSHAPPPDYALRYALASLGAGHILRSLFIEDAQIQFEHGGLVRLEEGAEARLRDSLDALTRAVKLVSPAFIESKDPGTVLRSSHRGI